MHGGGGGGVENKGYEGDGHLKNQRPSTTNSIQREKVKLRRSEKWRILKNIAVVSFAFMVQFTAFQVRFICFIFVIKILSLAVCGDS